MILDPEVLRKATDTVMQWTIVLGDSTDPVFPAKAFSENLKNKYALKNTEKDRFLKWSDRSFGINLDFTSDQVTRWIFSRCGDNPEPIKYGETIAIGLGTEPTWMNFHERTFGINLEFQNKPSCEWMILGGQSGTPVRSGDRVALYNTKSRLSPSESGEFLILFDRPAGHADIGWPTSQTLADNLGDLFTDNLDVVMAVTAAALKAL